MLRFVFWTAEDDNLNWVIDNVIEYPDTRTKDGKLTAELQKAFEALVEFQADPLKKAALQVYVPEQD